jgi:predicted ATPase with chaperone activity
MRLVSWGVFYPTFTIVGLPETEVKEARDRVRAAIQNGGYEMPAQRITVSLAPADLPKESGRPADRARHPGCLRPDTHFAAARL